MKAGKNLLWITLGLLFILAGLVISYALGWVLSVIIAGLASLISLLPGANVLAEILSGAKIVIHIIIMIIMMIYFWSKYEDKIVLKNFKDSFTDLFSTLKNKDYSKEKEVIGEYSSKIKTTVADTAVKIREKRNKNSDDDFNEDDIQENDEIEE